MTPFVQGMGAVAVACALLTAAPALAKKRALGAEERIDLNRAPIAELMRLSGCGHKRASAIVAYRARRPFRSVAEVLKVKGVRPKWFAKVKGHLAVSTKSEARPVPRS